MKYAARYTGTMLKKVLIPELEQILDSEKRVSHASLAGKVEGMSLLERKGSDV